MSHTCSVLPLAVVALGEAGECDGGEQEGDVAHGDVVVGLFEQRHEEGAIVPGNCPFHSLAREYTQTVFGAGWRQRPRSPGDGITQILCGECVGNQPQPRRPSLRGVVVQVVNEACVPAGLVRAEVADELAPPRGTSKGTSSASPRAITCRTRPVSMSQTSTTRATLGFDLT